MGNAIILKTNAVLSRPTVGVNKVIINFKDGGSTALVPVGQYGIYITKKHADATFKIKFYNGDWLTVGGNVPINPNGKSKKTYTDSLGNTINEYTYPIGYNSDLTDNFHYTVGTTRIEVCDIKDLSSVGCWVNEEYFNDDFDFDISQLAFTDFTEVNARYVSAKGDLSSLKNLTNLTAVRIQKSNITGDICNLAKSAKTLVNFSAYMCPISGTLEEFAVELQKNGAVSKTISFSLDGTNVTFEGHGVNMATITFDAMGAYTISSGN